MVNADKLENAEQESEQSALCQSKSRLDIFSWEAPSPSRHQSQLVRAGDVLKGVHLPFRLPSRTPHTQ